MAERKQNPKEEEENIERDFEGQLMTALTNINEIPHSINSLHMLAAPRM